MIETFKRSLLCPPPGVLNNSSDPLVEAHIRLCLPCSFAAGLDYPYVHEVQPHSPKIPEVGDIWILDPLLSGWYRNQPFYYINSAAIPVVVHRILSDDDVSVFPLLPESPLNQPLECEVRTKFGTVVAWLPFPISSLLLYHYLGSLDIPVKETHNVDVPFDYEKVLRVWCEHVSFPLARSKH